MPFNAYYRDAVEWLSDAGITTGFGETGEYRPDVPVNRAQMATFLWRLRDQPSAPPHQFVDVPSNTYFNQAVSWLSHAGVTTGVGGTNRYEPDQIVTRGQMAAFLHRIAGTPGGAPHHGFPDVAATAYYDAAVSWLKHHGITTGVGTTGLYEPDLAVTRAQMAAFIYRLATTPSAWNKSGTWLFGPGTFHVGSQIPPGTYRTRANRDGCYWERLSGFSGESHHRITNEFSHVSQIVTIGPSDRGFEAARGCGMFTNDLSPITTSLTARFQPGTYQVGIDIAAGTWRSSGGSGCYWERLSGFSGESHHRITNDFRHTPATVEISGSDVGFHATEGCGTWTRISG